MIGKITNEIVLKCSMFFNQEHLQQFQYVLASVLGEYEIKEKETSLITYDENLNKGYVMFFVAKKVEGLSQKTLNYYKSEIDNFMSFIQKPLNTIQTDDIRYYLAIKQTKQGNSETTADNTRRILNSFFSWLNAEGYVPKNPVYPIKAIKKKRKVKHALSDTEIEKLKEVCLQIEKPLERKRNIAIIETLLSTGCRVGELTTIKICDVDFSKNSAIVFGKGKKERRVFFNDKAMMRIKEYLEERNGEGDEYLFNSIMKPYKQLAISGTEILIRSLGKKARIQKCHPHKFRRTAATIALRRGMSLTDIQRMLGHESLETTKIYLDMDDSNLEMQHKKYM